MRVATPGRSSPFLFPALATSSRIHEFTGGSSTPFTRPMCSPPPFQCFTATVLWLLSLGVAVQVAFESKGLKTGNHFIGSMVETRRFQAIGQLDSTDGRKLLW
jgi:hypothetical protein